jgi:hypothetical protein
MRNALECSVFDEAQSTPIRYDRGGRVGRAVRRRRVGSFFRVAFWIVRSLSRRSRRRASERFSW